MQTRDSFGEKGNIVALQQSTPPWASGKTSGFVVGKLTSVDHRATLFQPGD
jgi:hypothetical protein